MKTFVIKIIQEYFHLVSKANTEESKKQIFKDLLARLYAKDETASQIIDSMSLGAEQTVLNIPIGWRNHAHGRADTQYGTTIIEFERNLTPAVEAHAAHQLKQYFAGNWNSGSRHLFTLIATDCTTWVVFGVNPESLISQETIRPELIELKETERFTLNGNADNASSCFYFLDCHLFRSELLKPTIESVQRDFGTSSPIFGDFLLNLTQLYGDIKTEPEIQTAYHEWNAFLSLAYGKFEGTAGTFLEHTYLSILAKAMAYVVLSGKNVISDDKIEHFLSGVAFEEQNVLNFTDNDFFRWVSYPKYLSILKPAIRILSLRIADYDFSVVDSDILKGIYQEMIDLETRHSLGEYYTPDWLCAEMLEHAAPKRDARILDPSCGSGSFLLAAIAYLKKHYPDLSAEDIATQVMGIDIHPLSVQISKTTYVLALGKQLKQERRPIQIPIYLANSLLSPTGVHLYGSQMTFKMAGHEYQLPLNLFAENTVFDRAVGVADELAEDYENLVSKETLVNALERQNVIFENGYYDSIFNLYNGLRIAKLQGKNGIWRFILKNSYKPFFLKQKFDWVVGNPPWITLANIPNGQYQTLLKSMAKDYALDHTKVANRPHLEIAAIFMAHAGSFYLKAGGKVAFVLPRSFLSAEHHHNTRGGIANGFRLNEIWDMGEVDNLFRVPSCVLWGTQAQDVKAPPPEGLPGRTYAGKPPRHNASHAQVAGKISKTQTRFFLARLNKNTAFSTQQIAPTGSNPYHALFRQGATIVPRNFYFIKILLPTPPDWHDRLIPAESLVLPEAKAPWKDITLRGRLNSNYFFRTALAKNIVPFALVDPMLVFLPAWINKHTNNLEIGQAAEFTKLGELECAKWLRNAERIWQENRTEFNEKYSLLQYLNWQNKLTDQDLSKPYLVIYTASAKDANACLVEREKLDLPFVVECTAYYYQTDKLEEAYFLVSFLNCKGSNQKIKEFQAKGLFGPRHVHKKILDVGLPKFDAADARHQALAALGQGCAQAAQRHLAEMRLKPERYNVGRVRAALRSLLATELQEIDTLLAAISR